MAQQGKTKGPRAAGKSKLPESEDLSNAGPEKQDHCEELTSILRSRMSGRRRSAFPSRLSSLGPPGGP